MAERGSEKKYAMKDERSVVVPIRDRVRFTVDMFPPGDDGRRPAPLGMSPYGKGIRSMTIPCQPPHSPNQHTPIEAGDPEHVAPRGYLHVIADARGTGHSEGEYPGGVSPRGARERYDVVESIAEQPRCEGNVGMVGTSTFGTIQLPAPAEQLPRKNEHEPP